MRDSRDTAKTETGRTNDRLQDNSMFNNSLLQTSRDKDDQTKSHTQTPQSNRFKQVQFDIKDDNKGAGTALAEYKRFKSDLLYQYKNSIGLESKRSAS